MGLDLLPILPSNSAAKPADFFFFLYVYNKLVQLPGFARARPQTPQPTHTTPTQIQPKKNSFFFFI
jgi:hypothetical protein